MSQKLRKLQTGFEQVRVFVVIKKEKFLWNKCRKCGTCCNLSWLLMGLVNVLWPAYEPSRSKEEVSKSRSSGYELSLALRM
jgi:hypothetical protein